MFNAGGPGYSGGDCPLIESMSEDEFVAKQVAQFVQPRMDLQNKQLALQCKYQVGQIQRFCQGQSQQCSQRLTSCENQYAQYKTVCQQNSDDAHLLAMITQGLTDYCNSVRLGNSGYVPLMQLQKASDALKASGDSAVVDVQAVQVTKVAGDSQAIKDAVSTQQKDPVVSITSMIGGNSDWLVKAATLLDNSKKMAKAADDLEAFSKDKYGDSPPEAVTEAITALRNQSAADKKDADALRSQGENILQRMFGS